MKKVFASDFDGTLYFHLAEEGRKLPPENVQKIKEFQAAGHSFGLCTGRQVGGLTPFIGGIIEPDFYITSSGANIVDHNLDEIQKRGVDPQTAQELIRRYAHDHRMTLDVEGEICVFAKMNFPGSYHVISGVEDAPKGRIHQVSIHAESEEEAQAIVEKTNEDFPDYVNAFRNVIEVDIAPKGCSKGLGVEVLRRHMKETYGDIRLYGIGDSMNDLPLIEASDVSYTFPYAPQELQDRVTKVVDTIVDALNDCMNDTME